MPLTEDIRLLTQRVTKDWTKTRKAEDRSRRQRSSRRSAYSDRTRFTEIAHELIPRGYEAASGGGQYPASKRQIFYACRTDFEAWTGEPLQYGYFAGTLLVQFLNRNPEQTETWQITADPRGTLHLPHVDQPIPVGTIGIDQYLHTYLRQQQVHSVDEVHHRLETRWPGRGPGERYQAVLFIEKEGFGPLLKAARIAERYNIAILAGKGQSSVAARKFVDHVCCAEGVPLLIVHDCDKAGFEIAQRLTQVSEWAEANDRVAYEFQNTIRWHDLGLRLKEAREFDLQDEPAKFQGHFASDSICTDEERAFLRSHRRIELNAFSSPQFIAWLEQQLQSVGIQTGWIPQSDDLLVEAYRRALALAHIQRSLDRAAEEAAEQANRAEIPDVRGLLTAFQGGDEIPWDQRLAWIARREVDQRQPEE